MDENRKSERSSEKPESKRKKKKKKKGAKEEERQQSIQEEEARKKAVQPVAGAYQMQQARGQSTLPKRTPTALKRTERIPFAQMYSYDQEPPASRPNNQKTMYGAGSAARSEERPANRTSDKTHRSEQETRKRKKRKNRERSRKRAKARE